MAADLLGHAIALAIVVVSLLSALGVSAVTIGHDSASDDARAGFRAWR